MGLPSLPDERGLRDRVAVRIQRRDEAPRLERLDALEQPEKLLIVAAFNGRLGLRFLPLQVGASVFTECLAVPRVRPSQV